MAKKSENVLKFRTPAKWWGEKWREGLLAGNGHIGANVYGGVAEERVLINDVNLSWLGRTNVVPDVSMKIRDVRKRINADDFIGAQEVLPTALKQKNFRPQAEYPLPLCELSLRFDVDSNPVDYSRSLDMDKGVVNVSYAISGTKFSRDVFVSRTDDVVVYRITKQGSGSINAELSLELMHRVNARTYEGICNIPEGAESNSDKQFLTFAARNDDDGTDFGAVARVIPLGGVVRAEKSGEMVVTNAQSLLIILGTFTGGSREKEWDKLKQRLSAFRDGFDKMLKSHVAVHSKLLGESSLCLSNGEDKCVEDLLLEAETGSMPPLLAEKIYNFSRYLLVSATADDGKFFLPTGIWNGSYMPYRSALNMSGEMPMTYLFTLQANMSVGLEKSFDYFEQNIGDYRNNAQRLFGCRGIVVPVVSAPNTGRLGSTDVFAIHFTGCAGWIGNFYYKYAVFNQNTKFLKQRLIPFMKEVALFYEDFFVENGGVLESSPSVLAMRIDDIYKVNERPVVAKNSMLDFAIARELLTNLIKSSVELGVNKGDVARWETLLKKLPKEQVASDGTLKEFVNSIVTMDYSGVSNGTLYPVYFSDEISFLSDEETLQTYLATANSKFSKPADQNSYNLLVLGTVFAKLGDAFKAKQCLTNAVRGCTMENLVFVDKDWREMGICGSGVWTPVQMQSNMVFANTLQQMLMYSNGNMIKVLPAFPSDWKYVEFSGFVTQNGVEVGIRTDVSKGTLTVTLDSKKDADVELLVCDNAKRLVKSNVQVEGSKRFSVKLLANKSAELVFKYNVK